MAGQLGLYTCETCPADCSVQQAPVFSINNCVDSIALYESEISVIYFVGVDDDDCTEPAAKPADWESASNWASVLSNTDNDKIRFLNVIGDMPEPEQQITTMSGGREKVGAKTFLVNYDIDEFNDDNYTAHRQLECGFTGFFWYGTKGGLLFGGPKGVKATVVKSFSPHERGENIYQKIVGQIKWKSNCSPAMIVNPIVSGTC